MTGVGEGRGAPARGAGGAFASVQRARGPAELGPSGEPGPNPAGGMLVSEPRSVVFESERSAGTPVKALDHAEGTLGHADAGGEPRARWEGERPADSLLVMDAPASSSGKHTLSFGEGTLGASAAERGTSVQTASALAIIESVPTTRRPSGRPCCAPLHATLCRAANCRRGEGPSRDGSGELLHGQREKRCTWSAGCEPPAPGAGVPVQHPATWLAGPSARCALRLLDLERTCHPAGLAGAISGAGG